MIYSRGFTRPKVTQSSKVLKNIEQHFLEIHVAVIQEIKIFRVVYVVVSANKLSTPCPQFRVVGLASRRVFAFAIRNQRIDVQHRIRRLMPNIRGVGERGE